MQSVGDAGCIAQVMIVVENGIRKRRGHVSDLLSLCHEVQGTMLDELQDIRFTIRSVQVNIALLLTHEGLVALRLEQFPCTDEVLYHIDIRTRLDVKVTCIKETTDIQSWNQFIRLILGICGLSLSVQVEVIAGRCLQVTLLERFTMPGTITLSHIHMVHMDGHPHISGRIRNLVIYMLINQEIIGTCLTILDIIDTRLLDRREVELHIIIFEVRTPVLDIPSEGLLRCAIRLDTHQ